MSVGNLLLDRLPREVSERIKSSLTHVTLPQGEVLHRPGEEIRSLYFPLTCMISVTIMMIDGRTIEVAAIGNRDVVGINAFMGGHETTQTEYVVQLPGRAMKIAASSLKPEFNRNTELRDLMLIYTQVFMAQMSHNIACIRLHTLDQRLARWLLEIRDRIQSDTFDITHEFISQMLGVRRAGVSVAASQLKEAKVIDYDRGAVRIVDVTALRERSCECFASLKEEAHRLLGERASWNSTPPTFLNSFEAPSS